MIKIKNSKLQALIVVIIMSIFGFSGAAIQAQFIGKFRTGSGVTVTKIERYSPLQEKTNADTVTFKITFGSTPTTTISANDFAISGQLAGTTAVLTGSGNMRYLKVPTTNASIRNGTTVKVTGTTTNATFGFNPTTNEPYNVRKVFMARIKREPESNAAPLSGIISLTFDEPDVVADLVIAVYSPLNVMPSSPDSIKYGCLYFNMPASAIFNVDFLTTNNTAYDAWGNDSLMQNWSFRIVTNKITMLSNSQAESMRGKFSMGNVSPNPVVSESNFTVNVFEEGNLNVAIYDLSGAFIMNILRDKWMNSGSELRVQMSLGLLPSGTYTVMVTLNNDILIQKIVIAK